MEKRFNLEIVNYTPKYLKPVVTLFINTVHKSCYKDYTQSQLDAWADKEIDYELWEKKLTKTKPYLAILDNRLVGFTEFYDDYIDCFYVDYKEQGKGVGKALFDHILGLAKNRNIKKIRVDASITSKPFFLSLGFIEVKMNRVKRKEQELVNFSLAYELN